MTSEDLSKVVSIQEAIVRGAVSDRWRQMISQHTGGGDSVGYVAEDDGQVIGFCLGEIKNGGFGVEVSGWLEVVGVAPNHMGSGVGQALAKRLLQHFREQSVLDIFTAVRWDSGDLLAFFKSLGFDRSPFINLQRRGDD